MTETIQTPRLLVATLRADSTLKRLGVKVYRGEAPSGAAMPYIVFRRYGGNDLDVIGGDQQGELYRFTLKAVGRIEKVADDELLEDVATAMHEALVAVRAMSWPATAPKIHCDGFIRESGIDLDYPASDNTKATVRELGGIYAAYVSAL